MFCGINPVIVNKKCSGKCEKVEADGLLNEEEEKNYGKVVCRRCHCVVFPPSSAVMVEKFPVKLKIMTHQGKNKTPYEEISWWWYTGNDMDFDTVGWQTVEGKKVLMCGDCEFGPFGFRTDDNKHFYVAVERVSYLDPDTEKEK